MTLALITLAYLIGSVQFGVLYSRVRGNDIRLEDAPGGSGIYRRYGFGAALGITLLDVLKGVLAVYLMLEQDPNALPWAIFAVTIGHNYPVFFGFNGGAGIATGLGAVAVASPLEVFILLGLAAVVGFIYKYTLQKRLGMFVVPFASLAALLILLFQHLFWGGPLLELLAFAVPMLIRSAHLLLKKRPALNPKSL
ncbi:MAG: glycerol-3-phosphate acyltransferase [Pseudopedobacter sp.]|nr:glycerol-3-phosphate acyltransferase [Deinococcales bacterium]